MISYGIFFYIVIRIFIILIITHFTEIVEAMLLNPGRQQDVIPRFGFDALVLELVMASMLCFQAMLGLRVVQSKKMWESWLLVRVTAVFIFAQIIITFFQFTFSYQTNVSKPRSNQRNTMGYYGHGDVMRIKSTLKDLKESIGMLLFACLLMILSMSVAFGCALINVGYYKFHNLCKEYERI